MNRKKKTSIVALEYIVSTKRDIHICANVIKWVELEGDECPLGVAGSTSMVMSGKSRTNFATLIYIWISIEPPQVSTHNVALYVVKSR